MNLFSGDFPHRYNHIRDMLVAAGHRVKADQWQSTAEIDPMKQVIELEFCTIQYPMPSGVDDTVRELQPNLPWAEEHFQERVGGVPVNPPPSHVNWPFAQGGNEKFTPDGRFSHSYPERLWSNNRYMTGPMDWREIVPTLSGKHALESSGTGTAALEPIATLIDLVCLLRDYPTTRQAFIPIWWPIDGVMAEKERVPCTIGYHFLLRDDMLHCHYFMRSCDAMRHLPDDLYMATRLTQWICDKLNQSEAYGSNPPWIDPGVLNMAITSLHIFEGDVAVINFQRSQR